MNKSNPSIEPAPLVVDLDADLLRGNLRGELFWAALRQDWRSALPGRGRPAGAAWLDAARLPFDETVLAEVRAARKNGRRTVLAGTDRAVAEAVAGALGCFDAVELPGAPRRQIKPRAPRPGLPVGLELLKAMRPHQWVKNLLVFLPMVMSQAFDLGTFTLSLLAFFSFGLIASAVYLVNDLADLSADRRHPTKRNRPFAAGRLPIAAGARMVPVLVLAGAGLALLAGPGLLIAMLAYGVTTTAYSFRLKGTLGADIILLAVLYTLRIIAGSAATGIVPSMWLLSFSIFLFLSLGAVKRLSELVDLEQDTSRDKAAGRAYQTEDRPVIAMISTSAGFVAVLVLALYIDSSEVKALYASPEILWGLCLVLLYWISRTVLLAHRGLVNQDPVVFALTDRVSQWTGVAAILLFVAAVLA